METPRPKLRLPNWLRNLILGLIGAAVAGLIVTSVLLATELRDQEKTAAALDKQLRSVESFASQVRTSLVQSCQQNGNPLRRAVRLSLRVQVEELERGIAESQTLDLQQLFPTVPPDELAALIADQNEKDAAAIVKLERRIKKIPRLTCERVYPEP